MAALFVASLIEYSGREHWASQTPTGIEAHSAVIAGLDPAIPIGRTRPCRFKRDHRVTARSLCPDDAKRRSGDTGPEMTTES
jgi:hypothetical protein